MNIAENLQRILQAKQNIATALRDKGVEVSETDTLDSFATKIQEMPTGGGSTSETDQFYIQPLQSYDFTKTDFGDFAIEFDLRYSLDAKEWNTWQTEEQSNTFKVSDLTANKYLYIRINKDAIDYNGGSMCKIYFINRRDDSQFIQATFIKESGGYMFYVCGYSLFGDNAFKIGYSVNEGERPRYWGVDNEFNANEITANTVIYDLDPNYNYEPQSKPSFTSSYNEETVSFTLNVAIPIPVGALDKLYLKVFNREEGFDEYTANYGFNTFIRPSVLYYVGGDLTTFVESQYYSGLLNNRSQNIYGARDLKLPVTTNQRYNSLFYMQTKLVEGPETLQDGALKVESCYANLFSGCSALVKAPKLPATTLSNRAYQYMFMNCTSLVNAPELPALTIPNNGYECMFMNCASLVKAPVLPANSFGSSAYSSLFYGCIRLNYIKCLATQANFFSVKTITYPDWVKNVSSTGTFVKSPNALWTPTRNNTYGIPSGWTIVDAVD